MTLPAQPVLSAGAAVGHEQAQYGAQLHTWCSLGYWHVNTPEQLMGLPSEVAGGHASVPQLHPIGVQVQLWPG